MWTELKRRRFRLQSADKDRQKFLLSIQKSTSQLTIRFLSKIFISINSFIYRMYEL